MSRQPAGPVTARMADSTASVEGDWGGEGRGRGEKQQGGSLGRGGQRQIVLSLRSHGPAAALLFSSAPPRSSGRPAAHSLGLLQPTPLPALSPPRTRPPALLPAPCTHREHVPAHGRRQHALPHVPRVGGLVAAAAACTATAPVRQRSAPAVVAPTVVARAACHAAWHWTTAPATGESGHSAIVSDLLPSLATAGISPSPDTAPNLRLPHAPAISATLLLSWLRLMTTLICRQGPTGRGGDQAKDRPGARGQGTGPCRVYHRNCPCALLVPYAML